MATTFTATQTTSNSLFKPFPDGMIGVRETTYVTSAAWVINDVVQMIKVFEGERVLDVQMLVETDADTGGSPAIVMAVGDGVDNDRYVSASAIGQAGGFVRLGQGLDTAAEAASLRYTYPADDTIDIKITTAPATGVAAVTVTLRALISG